MSLFTPPEAPDCEPSAEAVAQALIDVKRQVRDRRIALVAPVVLAAAVLVAFVAAPPRHGGLTLVPEAEAADEALLPQVFGANGVWRLAEPIGESLVALEGPPWLVDVPAAPTPPAFVLAPPDEPPFSTSLPASASTPPTPTLGQIEGSALTDDPRPSWAAAPPEIRLRPAVAAPATEAASPESDAEPAPASADGSSNTGGNADDGGEIVPVAAGETTADPAQIADDGVAAGPMAPNESAHESAPAVAGAPNEAAAASARAVDSPDLAPDASDSAEAVAPPDHTAIADEPSGSAGDGDDVSGLREEPGPSGDAVTNEPTGLTGTAADTDGQPEANPSTPPAATAEPTAQPSSTVATIAVRSVLVHSAHVSVTVWVGDDDSSVIDWCNTRVDWGDGSVTGLLGPDETAACAAPCEHVAFSSGPGISNELTFEHQYALAIDAAPRIFVATGDGCSYTLAELQLNPFTVVPY